ncbi:MAG: hypothetical protein P1U56_02390 [Saprospiraceae bacterium]|nr:hypothetical protein [Saprospiraceae bacterium]
MDYVGIGILISVGINFIYLYNRKKKWLSVKIKWTMVGLLFLIGTIGMLSGTENEDILLFFWCLMTPLFFVGIVQLFTNFTIQSHQRDFYLCLRYSDEYNAFGKNKHVKAMDKVISIFLVISIVVLPLLFQWV